MSTASRPGGLYYIGDTAVDAEGRAIEGAPVRGPNTPRELQPGANAETPTEQLARAIKNLAAAPVAVPPVQITKSKREE